MIKQVSRRTVVKSAAAGAAIAASGLGFPSVLRANDQIKVGFIGPISGFMLFRATIC